MHEWDFFESGYFKKNHRCLYTRPESFIILVMSQMSVIYNPKRSIMKKMQKMAYKKPQLVAKNNPTGSFAAGCPTAVRHNGCTRCELAN